MMMMMMVMKFIALVTMVVIILTMFVSRFLLLYKVIGLITGPVFYAISVTNSTEREEHNTCNKMKEGQLDWSHLE